jgi:adenylate cyclase
MKALDNTPRSPSLPPTHHQTASHDSHQQRHALKVKIAKKLKQDVADAGLVILTQPYSEILELGGLDRDEVKEILKFTLKVDNVADELADLVVNVSSGNPFWCRSIATFIKDLGLEEFDKVTTTTGKDKDKERDKDKDKEKGNKGKAKSPNDSSEMLKALIICRMEKLTTDDQMVLRHASIIGQEFTAKLLNAILPFRLRNKTVLETLGELVGHGFLLCLEESPDHKFAFQNPLIQSVIYSLTTPR